MKNLIWTACNGVKPDLPDGTMVKPLEYSGACDYFSPPNCIPAGSVTYWPNVIAYALEPKDPVRELVGAAKDVLDPNNFSRFNKAKLAKAIKAVEDTL